MNDKIRRLEAALARSTASLEALRRFVPASVAEAIEQGRMPDGQGRLLELTVMFTDIEGFTSIAASVPPQQLVPQLTEYFNATASVLVALGGTLDKYMGDGMLVLWGAPDPLPDAPYRACTAALAMQAELDRLNAQWQARGLPRLDTRVGIHTGPAVVGVLGSQQRLAFTAFGDSVNVASRIERLNKDHGTRILASRRTVDALGGRLPARLVGEVELRGRAGRWALYEIRPAATPAS